MRTRAQAKAFDKRVITTMLTQLIELLIGGAVFIIATLGLLFGLYYFCFFNPFLAKSRLSKIVVLDESKLSDFRHIKVSPIGINMRNSKTNTFMAISRQRASEFQCNWLPSELTEDTKTNPSKRQLVISKSVPGEIPICAIKLWKQGDMTIAGEQFSYCKALQKSPIDGSLSSAFWACSLDRQNGRKTNIVISVSGTDRGNLDLEVTESLKIIKAFSQ